MAQERLLVLPPGWGMHASDQYSSHTYYYHGETDTSQWERPSWSAPLKRKRVLSFESKTRVAVIVPFRDLHASQVSFQML